MLGQLTDEVYRRHLVVTTELATLDEQVAAFKNVVEIVSLRVILCIGFRLFKYRLVGDLAAIVAFTPFGEFTKTIGDVIQLLRQTACVGMSLAFITIDSFVDYIHP